MIVIKTAKDIKNGLVSFYSKIQDEITDFTPTSIIGGIFYAISVQLEKVYTEIEDVKKQSFTSTAEGLYLDRHIEGTFGIARNQKTRSSGYVVIYSNSPIQNPDNLKLSCAYFDSAGELIGADSAEKFVTSGNDAFSGRVFVLVTPSNKKAFQTQQDENGKEIRTVNLMNANPRFMILPVVSYLAGESNNVPEGSINQYPSRPAGVDGVLNTYSPQAVFFASPDSYNVPFSVRFTPVQNIRNTSNGSTVLDVVLGYYFSNSGGALEFEDSKANKLRGRYYKRTNNFPYIDLAGPYVEKNVTLDYIEAQKGTITLLSGLGSADNLQSSMDALPSFKRRDDSGVLENWILGEVAYDTTYIELFKPIESGQSPVLPDKVLFDSLLGRLGTSKGLIVRQAKVDLDRDFIFDPDGVLGLDGVIPEGYRIGGAIEKEEDAAYRLKLTKYLSSLPRATDAAIEAGALQVRGVTYAKVVRSLYTPRGSTILLVSGKAGIIDKSTFYKVKKFIDREWKASGINLIVKTPQQVQLTMLMSVTLDKNYSKSREFVDEKIRSAVLEYFSSKNPGDSISYSEVISLISRVEGVRNVWNMFFGNKLKTEMYLNGKSGVYLDSSDEIKFGGYDYQVCLHALKNKSLAVELGGELSEGYREDIYVYDPFSSIPDSKVKYKKGSNLNYAPTQSDTYKRCIIGVEARTKVTVIELIEDATWELFVSPLRNFKTSSEFIDYLTSNKDIIFSYISDEPSDVQYAITQLLSDVSLLSYDSSVFTNIPVKVSEIPLKSLGTVELDTFEVPSVSKVAVGTESLDLIGIEYIL